MNTQRKIALGIAGAIVAGSTFGLVATSFAEDTAPTPGATQQGGQALAAGVHGADYGQALVNPMCLAGRRRNKPKQTDTAPRGRRAPCPAPFKSCSTTSLKKETLS